MAAARKLIGRVKCHCCGESAAAKEQGGTAFTCYSCPWCGLFVQAHAPESDAALRKLITPLRPGEPEPGEVKPPKPPKGDKSEKKLEEKTAPREPEPERTIFDLLKPAKAAA